jgi:hypothetical protein
LLWSKEKENDVYYNASNISREDRKTRDGNQRMRITDEMQRKI